MRKRRPPAPSDARRSLGVPDFALPLIDELDSLPPAAPWGDWLDRLFALASRAIKRPERVLAVFSELAPLAPVGPVDLGEIVRALGRLLIQQSLAPPSQRYGKLFVGPVEAARGLTFDAVFVPGSRGKDVSAQDCRGTPPP